MEQHKRITDILFHHWNEVRGERMFPERKQIDEFILQKNGVWEDSFIIEAYPLVDSNGYRFVHTGQNLGKDYTSEEIDEKLKNEILSFLSGLEDRYNIVAEQKRPLQHEESFTSPETGITIKYRQILLPLGPGDDDPVDSILGGMRFVKE